MDLRRSGLVLAVCALGLTACSASVEVNTSPSPTTSAAPSESALYLPKATVEQQVSDQLTKTVGSRPDSVTCPDDLPGYVGATMRCTLTAGGDTIGLTVTVTSVDGTDVKFDIKVDDTVQSSSPTG